MLTDYALNLSIKPRDEESPRGLDLLGSASAVVRDWIGERSDLASLASEGSGEWHDPDDELRERLQIVDDHTTEAALFSLDWEREDREGHPLRWRTRLTAATSDDCVEVAIHLKVLGADGELIDDLPDAVRIDSPRIATMLIEQFDCHFGTQPITNRVNHVDAATAERFTWETIMNPERPLPVVVVSSRQGRYRREVGKPALDCDRLATRLAGLANVALYDPNATWALGRMLGRRFPCFGGAVRVYLPEWSPDDDSWTHLLLKPDVVEKDETAAAQQIFEYCARFQSELPRYAGQDAIDNAEAQVREAQERAHFRDLIEDEVMNEHVEPLLQRLSDLERERSALSNEITDLKKTAQATRDTRLWNQELEADNEQLQQTVRDQQAEIEDLRRDNDNLRAQLPDLRVTGNRITSRSTTETGEDEVDREDEPANMVDVIRVTKERYPRVEIMEPAARDALNSDFRRPAEVLRAFEKLSELADLRAAGESTGERIERWLADRGVRYSAFESGTTKGKYGDERRVREGGTEWLMEAHLKFGGGRGGGQNMLRVYLMWHENRWKIGRIVSHFTNTQT